MEFQESGFKAVMAGYVVVRQLTVEERLVASDYSDYADLAQIADFTDSQITHAEG